MRLDDLYEYLNHDPFATKVEIKSEVVKLYDDDIVQVVKEVFGAEEITSEDRGNMWERGRRKGHPVRKYPQTQRFYPMANDTSL